MDEMENKLGAILSNPEMMQKIMAFAQTLNPPEGVSEMPKEVGASQETPPPILPDIDFSMIQKLTSFAQSSTIDKNQQTLLRALSPYLNNRRIVKLERAMRAAKMAGIATAFLGR